MTSQEAKDFIFSKPEWKDHFLKCCEKLDRVFETTWCLGHQGGSDYDFHHRSGWVVCFTCSRRVRGYEHNPDRAKVPEEVDMPTHIANVIRREEELYHKTLQRGKSIVHKYVEPNTIPSADLLCWLRHTHGLEPFDVEDVLDVTFPSSLHDEYLTAYAVHRKTGSKGYVPEVIIAKTL